MLAASALAMQRRGGSRPTSRGCRTCCNAALLNDVCQVVPLPQDGPSCFWRRRLVRVRPNAGSDLHLRIDRLVRRNHIASGSSAGSSQILCLPLCSSSSSSLWALQQSQAGLCASVIGPMG